MTTGTKVLLGILGAAAAGVVVGLLIAPEKGSETRKRLASTAGDWADQVGGLFKNGRNEYENLKDKARGMKSAAEQKNFKPERRSWLIMKSRLQNLLFSSYFTKHGRRKNQNGRNKGKRQ